MYGLVDELNDMETEMIGMKPKDAIKLDEVPLVARESYPPSYSGLRRPIYAILHFLNGCAVLVARKLLQLVTNEPGKLKL